MTIEPDDANCGFTFERFGDHTCANIAKAAAQFKCCNATIGQLLTDLYRFSIIIYRYCGQLYRRRDHGLAVYLDQPGELKR